MTSVQWRGRRLAAALVVSAATVLGGMTVTAGPAAATTAPSINECQVFRPVLKRGVQGQAGCVAAVQSFLHAYYGTGVDGKFGPETERDVKAFQRWQGISADGVVGTNTWGRIQVECNHRGDCDYHAQY
ncbi:peptidoglycan-binding domain-containing protein [Nocardia sp. NPDC050710]|uniref:peptidoglycan-binding domain-containing protein n=1 Tax=Nocardia sp. NPDC050710 TaxID=3157220 RepID=UPI0033FF79B3